METLSLVILILYVAAAVVMAVYGINCYVMVILCARHQRRERRRDREDLEGYLREHTDDDLPVVTTQLPLFNEANVAERLIRAVCAFKYPAGKHEIQVLDDSTDHTLPLTRHLVAELRSQGHDIHLLHRTDRAGYKAGALAAGMERARGEYLAVFDADFVPPEDFLTNTIPFLVMEPELGFVQTRWGHRNRDFSLLTIAQSIGIDGHFAVEQSARSWNGLFLNFNGTAGVWRKETIHDAGGWESDTLTEDLDLSYRAQLAGWKPRYLVDVVTPAEVPTDINALKTQQHRWAKGSIETALKLLPRVLARRDIGIFKKAQAFLHLTHYMIHPVMLIMAFLVLPLLLLCGKWARPELMVGLLVAMLVSMMAPNALYLFAQRLTREDWKRTILYLPALMVLGVGLAVNNSRAVLEALLGVKSEFVRTPKLGDAAERAPAPRSMPRRATIAWYREPRNRLFLLELFLGLWSFAAFLVYLSLTKFIIGPLLLINAVGYTTVGLMTLLHERRMRLRTARY